MGRPTPLVLALHGTKSLAGQQVAGDLVRAVATRLPGVEVHLGWADVLTPTLTETLSGIGEAVIVPGFLTAGFHVTSDLPAAIQASGGRARLGGMIGPALVAAVAERLLAAGDPGDAVVLAAAGSLRPRSVAEVTEAARQLSGLVGRPVMAGFLTAARPSVTDAVAQLRASGHDRISIASYLLAPGVFSERLHSCGADMVSAPIGVHPLVVEAVASAYAAVVDERRDVPGQAPGVGRERIA
ncbi:MAG TPA: CbiX/SirB N-terminal domain-containing protein [Propionicimonas sp.]|jgi:sirohydrochlorin ferrochelatase|uniref:sirohydrochlorin chelatase n=1 Tax=Propionicimonas sp. TaxID=1955623 RepID=UPI002F424E2C